MPKGLNVTQFYDDSFGRPDLDDIYFVPAPTVGPRLLIGAILAAVVIGGLVVIVRQRARRSVEFGPDRG
jgi:hypothetical protein